MGFSNLKIPKLCEFCEKPFEAKTVATRFCSKYCSEKNIKKQKQLEKEDQAKQNLLEQSKSKIAEVQSRPFISVSEAKMLFGISKDTIHRLIKSGRVPAHNFGQRLTRVSRLDLEKLFTAVEIAEEKTKPLEEQNYFEIGNCFTISEASAKFHADPGTVLKAIKKHKIPTKKVGSFVYVPKVLINQIFDPQ